MHDTESRWLDAHIDHDVDIVGRSHLGHSTFDLVQEHHLPSDEEPMRTEVRCQFDECLPRLTLSSQPVMGDAGSDVQWSWSRSAAAIRWRGSADSSRSSATAPSGASGPAGMTSQASSSTTRSRIEPSGSTT